MDKETLLNAAAVVRDENTESANTATRIGELFIDTIETLFSTMGGIRILAVLSSVEDLPDTAGQGDCYLIDGNVYLYVGRNGNVAGHPAWSFAGTFRGPQGERGPAGQNGVSLGEVAIVDDLTTGGSESVLSAEQGKILKQEQDENSNKILVLEADTEDIPRYNIQQTISIIQKSDFVNVGFVRPAGNVSAGNNSYRYTDFINIEGLTSILLHTRTGASTVSPAVFFREASFDTVIEGVNGDLQEKDYTIEVPSGAKYMVTSAMFTFIDQSDNFSCISHVSTHVGGLSLTPIMNITQIYGGTYDLSSAIEKVPSQLQIAGLVLTFLDSSNKVINKQWSGKGLFSDITKWKDYGAEEKTIVYRKKTYRFFADELFTETGLIKADGSVSANSSFLHTNPIDLASIEKIYIHTKVVGNTATTFYPVVVWYDNNNTLTGYENCLAGENDYELTIPDNAAFAVFNSLAAFTKQDLKTVCDVDIVSKEPFVNKVYISPSGNDSNDGLSYNSPVASLLKVNKILSPDGELVMLPGDYENLPLDLSNFNKITGHGNVRVIGGVKITSATQTSGYNRVWQVAAPIRPVSGVYLWQHDIPDTETEIPASEIHPCQRGKTYRLPSTRLYPASSIQDIEASTDKLKWYLSNGTLYFSKTGNSNLLTNPIIIPAKIISGNVKRSIEIRNIHFLYSSILLTNLHGLLENVSAGMVNAAGAIRYDSANDFTFRNCEAYACNNDGFNGHGTSSATSYITFENCWAHDNSDDGESCHEYCNVTQHGGLYEYNGNGCTPASGGRATYYNTMARKNLPSHAWTGVNREGTGFSAQGAASAGAETSMFCSCCYATGNTIGMRSTLSAGSIAFNCVVSGNQTNTAGSISIITL